MKYVWLALGFIIDYAYRNRHDGKALVEITHNARGGSFSM